MPNTNLLFVFFKAWNNLFYSDSVFLLVELAMRNHSEWKSFVQSWKRVNILEAVWNILNAKKIRAAVMNPGGVCPRKDKCECPKL